jgi:hypothetical protein
MKLKAVILIGTCAGILLWAGGFYLLFALSLSDFDRALVKSLVIVFTGILLVVEMALLQLSQKVAALERLALIKPTGHSPDDFPPA